MLTAEAFFVVIVLTSVGSAILALTIMEWWRGRRKETSATEKVEFLFNLMRSTNIFKSTDTELNGKPATKIEGTFDIAYIAHTLDEVKADVEQLKKEVKSGASTPGA